MGKVPFPAEHGDEVAVLFGPAHHGPVKGLQLGELVVEASDDTLHSGG